MDPAELDRILPLEVVPQPKKVSRIALVIVKGIDPAIDEELDQLIKKLGDPSWKIREAATAEIRKLGVAHKPRLEEAAKNNDTEVAFRRATIDRHFQRVRPGGEQRNEWRSASHRRVFLALFRQQTLDLLGGIVPRVR